MRLIESQRIREELQKHHKFISKNGCLDVGSSTIHYRNTLKSHINEEIHQPLSKAGIRVYTSDLKDESENDFNGNIFDPAFFSLLKSKNFSAIFCFNVLEHVVAPYDFMNQYAKLLAKEGLLFISVPYSYPHHNDPIDTLFRPTPLELESGISGFKMIHSEIIIDDTFLREIVRLGFWFGVKRLIISFLKLCRDMIKLDFEVVKNNRILWFFRSYKITFVVLKKC